MMKQELKERVNYEFVCPKCSLKCNVKTSVFLCSRCGFSANVIYCRCECGQTLLDKNHLGYIRQFINGHHRRGAKHSDEAKVKMSLANKGKPGYWKGKKKSDQHRHNISKTLTGRRLPDEVREKRKGRKLTDECKKKISEGMKGHTNAKGRKYSEEERKRVSERMKGNTFGKNWSEERRNRMRISRMKQILPTKDTKIERSIRYNEYRIYSPMPLYERICI